MKSSTFPLRSQSESVWSLLYLLGLGVLFLAGFGGNAKPILAQSSNGTTVLNIGSSVQQAGVKRLGINTSGQSFYDSGQMMRNLTFANSGFEGESFQSVLKCNVASGTTCADSDLYNQWPANFMKGATFEFIYGQAKGQKGTIVSSSVSNFPAHLGPTFDFGTAHPAAGDVFILHQSNENLTNQIPDAGWWSSANGGATITTETTDLSPNTQGKQALKMSASGSGQSAGETSYFDTIGGRSFVQLNGTYTMYFRAKSIGGSNQLNISVTRLGTSHGSINYLDKTVNLTNSWQDYSYSFTANEDGTYIGPVSVNWYISGGSMLLDDAYLEEAAAPDNPTAYRNAVVDRLRQYNPGVIRYMDNGADFGSSIDNMIAPAGARLRTGYGEGQTVQTQIPLGLEEFLVLCQAVGAEPWYTMPSGMSTTEIQNLMEFLNGSSSTPYGAKRAALGQAEPWTSVFPSIHLELGNETWNITSFPGEMYGDPFSYGDRVGTIFGAAKAAPSYNASKIDLIADGWGALPTWWNLNVMAAAKGNYDTLDAAPYTFDSLYDYSSNEAIYGSMFAQPEAVDSTPSGYMYQQMQVAATAPPKPAKLAVYEVNLGTIEGTAPQNVLDAVVPSVGAGISVAEHMLLMMRDDNVVLQNMFALPEYTNGYINFNGGNESVKLWGTVVDMGGQTNLCRPQFLAGALANSAIMGDLVNVEQSGSNPTWDVNSKNDNISMKGAHYIQSFAFANGSQRSLIVFNLSRTQALPINFTGSNAPTGTVQVGVLTSANITDTNESQSNVAVSNSTMTFNASTKVSLPPFSMTVYRWNTNGGSGPAAANTTTTLTASPATVTSGQAVTLKASVAATDGSATPTGNVNFYDGSASLGGTALSNGQVSISTSNLAVGAHTLTAVYAGTSTDNGSTSTPVTVTVNSAAANAVSTSTTLQAPASVVQGQTATLTAKVTAASGSTPTGTVSFMTGQLVLGSGQLSNGIATFTSTVNLAPGQYSIVASYAGTSTDKASTSSATTVTVNQGVSSTTTTLQAPSNVTQGKPITLTAKVTPSSGGTPTGSVTFKLGSTTLGSAQLNGGSASYTGTVNLSAGSYAAVATYTGSSSDNPSTSSSDNVTVTQSVANTSTTLSAPKTDVINGEKVSVTVNVKAASGATPSGSVSLYIGSYQVTTLQLNNGQATYTATLAMQPGSYQLVAKYAGDSIDNASQSAPLNFTVTATTAVNLTSGATQVVEGSPVALTASVTPQFGNGTATGAVSFYLGQTAIATQQLSNGIATASPPVNLAPGQYPLTAVYAGDADDQGATSNLLTLTVTAPAVPVISTNTTLTATPTQLIQGQTMQLAALVTAASGSTPTGSISFYLGQTQIGTAVLASAKGSSSLANASINATMAPGTYQLTAVYAGTSQDSASSSAPVTITIEPSVVATSTTLVSSASQLIQGQSLSLTATVAASNAQSPVPQGNVNFYLGQTELGSAALAGGQATWTGAASFAPGTYQLTAVYTGTSSDSTSTSTAVSLTINSQAVNPTIYSTTTTLAINPSQVTAGQALTLSAQVAEQGGTANATGSVAFYLGQTQIGTALLNSGQAAWTGPASFAPGSYQVTAVYSGDALDTTSTSSPVSLTVNSAVVQPTTFSTLTALTVNPQTVQAGQSMTIAVQVSEVAGTSVPTGAVSFYLGQTQVGTGMLTNGMVSVTTTAPPAGTYSLTASYAGQGEDLASQSQPVMLTVQPDAQRVPNNPPPATFTLGLSGNSVSLSKGQQSASLQVLLAAVQGYQGAVQLSCSGLPAGVSCNFSPSTVALQTASASSTLSLSMGSSTSAYFPMMTNVTYAMQLPWSFVGLFGLFSNRKRLRFRFGTLAMLLLVISGGLIAMTGCGLTVNNATLPYQVSVTAVGANQQTQTQSFTLYVTGPAAKF